MVEHTKNKLSELRGGWVAILQSICQQMSTGRLASHPASPPSFCVLSDESVCFLLLFLSAKVDIIRDIHSASKNKVFPKQIKVT